MKYHCYCGRFLAKVRIEKNKKNEIIRIIGVCKKHGVVDVTRRYTIAK